MGANDTQGNPAAGEFGVQMVQHARAREVEIRRG
jgi:hypothetical protein